MNLSDLKEWILVISGSVTLLSVAIGSLLAFLQYRMKSKSEKAEVDVRLLKAFTELMDLANGRGGYVVSEKAIEELFKRKPFSEIDIANVEQLKQQIGEFPIFTLPVGNAAQDAAIAAIATLANRHEVLKEVAIQALESVKTFKPEMAEKHLKRINT